MNLRNLTLLVTGLILIVLFASAGAYWVVQRQQYEQDKKEFLSKCRDAMLDDFEEYYLSYGEVPREYDEMVFVNCSFQQIWIYNGFCEFGFNEPSVEEGYDPFLELVFEDTLPVVEMHLDDWKEKRTIAMEPIRRLEGDVEGQLGYFRDPHVEIALIGSLLKRLNDEYDVSEETLYDFHDALGELRIAKARQWAKEQAPWRVPDLSEEEIEQQIQEKHAAYELAKRQVLEEAGLTKDSRIAEPRE